MSGTNLIRLGGLAAIFAGILRGVNSFLPNDAPGVLLEILYLLTDIFILFGIMGVYGFQHEESGLWGFFGFLLAIIGTGIIIGPDGAISGVNMYPVGSLILAGGLTLLAVGSWIANKLPWWVPTFWVLSTIVGFIGYFVPGLSLLFVISGVIFGIGFAGAGIKIWSATSQEISREPSN
ncbi:hypothetical protein [Phormidesmis priestleyi]